MTIPDSYFGTNNFWRGFSDLFLGTPAQVTQKPLYNPQQMNMLDTFLQRAPDTVNQVTDFYNSILSGDQSYFDAIEKPSMDHFRNKTVPAIMDRVGRTSGVRSSALGQQLGDAAVKLDTELAASKALKQDQAAAGLQNLMKFGMTPTQQFFNQQHAPGIIEASLPVLAALFGMM